jgi:hypothetical protein
MREPVALAGAGRRRVLGEPCFARAHAEPNDATAASPTASLDFVVEIDRQSIPLLSDVIQRLWLSKILL